jgi:hypothetical protein
MLRLACGRPPAARELTDGVDQLAGFGGRISETALAVVRAGRSTVARSGCGTTTAGRDVGTAVATVGSPRRHQGLADGFDASFAFRATQSLNTAA